MRTWRKLHSSILDSSDIEQLSDGAALLLVFLIPAQDDTGWYPWTPSKVKRLIATRQWSHEQARAFADELVAAGIAIMIIGGTLWFRAGIGLDNISDDLSVIETFTNDVNRMKTILSLEDDRQIRQITQAVGFGAIVAGALVTIYAYTRPRR